MRRDRRWAAYGAALGLAPSTTSMAAAEPILCQQGETATEAERGPVPAESLPGLYRCVEEGVTLTLSITADGRFEQRFAAKPGLFSDLERADLEAAGRTGQWRLEGDTLYLFERPRRAPTLQLVESVRDPSVWLRIDVRDKDGQPARGLFVGEGEDANPRSELTDGVLVIPSDYAWEPGLQQIVRHGDDLRLASFTVARDGPNVFRFVYQPSEVAPFEIRAQVLAGKAPVIGVPFGIGGALLRRVPAGE